MFRTFLRILDGEDYRPPMPERALRQVEEVTGCGVARKSANEDDRETEDDPEGTA
jgi:hypothetical protein